MACTLTTTLSPFSGCGATQAGLDELHHWLINRADISFGAISSSTGVATTFTVSSALLPWNFDSRGFEMFETMNTDQNTGAQSHKPTITGRMIGLSGANRAKVESLKGTNLVSIVRTKSGKFIVNGYTSGLSLDTNDAGSKSDNLGDIVTLSTSENNPESKKYFELLMTDEATTLAALIAEE